MSSACVRYDRRRPAGPAVQGGSGAWPSRLRDRTTMSRLAYLDAAAAGAPTRTTPEGDAVRAGHWGPTELRHTDHGGPGFADHRRLLPALRLTGHAQALR